MIIILQNKTFLLEDIFHFDGKNKSKIKINRGIRRIKGESDKEYEIRMIENKSFNNKLNENYVKKMSLLLYDSINYKDYAKKRNNLNKTTYKNIGPNKLRLTFKKFPTRLVKGFKNNLFNKNNEHKENKNENQEKIIFFTPDKKYNQKIKDEIKEKSKFINESCQINNEIKEILCNDNEKISIIEEKRIYDKMKPRFPYLKLKLIKQLKSPIFASTTTKEPLKINFVKSPPLSPNNSLLLANQTNTSFSTNFNITNIFKTCNSLKVLRDKNKLNKEILSNKKELYKKIKEELKPVKEKKDRKKKFLSQYEVFYYDANKWNKIRKEKEANKDKLEFYGINSKFNGNIQKMDNKIKDLRNSN